MAGLPSSLYSIQVTRTRAIISVTIQNGTVHSTRISQMNRTTAVSSSAASFVPQIDLVQKTDPVLMLAVLIRPFAMEKSQIARRLTWVRDEVRCLCAFPLPLAAILSCHGGRVDRLYGKCRI
jgi:hypothetical protein